MHEEIKKFSLDGSVASTGLVRQKDELFRTIDNMMREEGYVPVLDIDPQYSHAYNFESESFDFRMTLYGVDVGEDKSWDIAGTMYGKMVPKHTQPTK